MKNVRRASYRIFASGFLSLGVASFAQAATVNLQWNGSGCPKADEHSESASDRFIAKKEMEGNFEVKRGAGVRMSDSRKNCTLLLVSEESKEQIALEKIEVIGKKSTAAGPKHELTVDVSTQGQAQTKSISIAVPASKVPKFDVEKVIADADLQWSPCDRGLMVNAKQRVEGSEAVTASIESVTYSFRTKACSK